MSPHEIALAFWAWCGGLSCASVMALYAVRAPRWATVLAVVITAILAALTLLTGANG